MSETEKEEKKCCCGGDAPKAEKKCCCKCKWAKRLLKILAIIVAVLLILVIAAPLYLGPTLKKSINTLGPKMMGVPLSVGKIHVSLLGGSLRINDFVLGNPEGYNTDSLMKFDEVYVKLKPLSVFSKVIHVETVEVQAPHITYEVGLGNSNVGKLLENLEKLKKEEEESDDENGDDEEKAKKRVVIDKVVVSDGQVNLSAKLMGGAALPVPLPTVTLNDLGKADEKEATADVDEKEGITILEATCEILIKVCTSVVDAAKAGGKAILDGAKAGGDAILDGAKSAGSAAVDAAKNAGSAVKDASAAAVDAAKSAGSAIADGVSSAGSAVKDASAAAVEGLKKLNPFGGDDDKK